jgi:hypothetical protein
VHIVISLVHGDLDPLLLRDVTVTQVTFWPATPTPAMVLLADYSPAECSLQHCSGGSPPAARRMLQLQHQVRG